MGHRRARLLALVALLVAGGAFGDQAPGPWQGEKLSDFLRGMGALGLRVIFSSDLVSDAYELTEEPDLQDPEAALATVLADFGLGIAPGPGGSLLVVRATAGGPADTPPQRSRPDIPLPEIVVTSSLHRVENVHTDTHRYFDRELSSRVPTTGDEVVRVTNQLPGTASSGISARNHVRGGEVNEVLFLLDGLRLYEPFHLKNFQSVATIVNPALVAGIDFYSGAFPAHFGDRMSGVMRLDLREAGAATETELGLSFFNASALSLGSFGDEAQGDWLVSARRGNLDLLFDVVDPERGTPRYNDVMLRMGWEAGPRAALRASYLQSTDKIRLNDPGRGETATARYRNEVAWIDWSADWNASLTSRTLLAHTSISNRRAGAVDLPGIVAGTIDEDNAFRIAALKQDWAWRPAEAWQVAFGFEARDIDGRFDYNANRSLEAPFDDVFEGMSSYDRDAEIKADGSQFALYMEARHRFGPRVVVEAGMRWDQQSYTLAERDEQTSPRLSLLYQAGARTELRLGWGQYSQAQEVNELQVSDGVYEYFPAQRAEHVVANLEHDLPSGVSIGLSVYRKSFRKLRPRYENAFNPLSILPEIQFDRFAIDARRGKSRGAELTLSRQSPDRSTVWWLGYARAAVEDETASGELKRGWDQPHTAKAGLSWRWRRWNFSATARVHTGWPRTELVGRRVADDGGEPGLDVERTGLYARRHGSFRTFDIRVSRLLALRRGKLDVFLDVTNLADSANPCCLEYAVGDDGAGPVLEVRESGWLPILPSLGAVWRF